MQKKLKAREDGIRRRAAKHGYRLSKTPARSALRKKYGVGYQVQKGRSIVLGVGSRPFTATLKHVERFFRRRAVK